MDAAVAVPALRFAAKRDAWLVAVLWAASLVDVAAAAWLALGAAHGPAWLAPLLVLVAAFQLHVLYGTHYAFTDDALVIRASLFRWRVPLAAVDAVEPSRNPLSSPAPSLDRLRIAYGGKRILISPLDQAGFLRALAARAPQLEARGAGLRRRAA